MSINISRDGVDMVMDDSYMDGHSANEDDGSFARIQRNDLLAATDTWGLSDYPTTAEQTAYRQALRDITDQSGFPIDITWPTKPE
jgi:hydrogenase maturation factor HypE